MLDVILKHQWYRYRERRSRDKHRFRPADPCFNPPVGKRVEPQF
jgi:hypothetical protein